MPDLQLNKHWELWAPSLDGNDKLERPFLFEICCGLTRAELRKLDDDLSRELRTRTGAATELVGPAPERPAEADDAWRAAMAAWQEKLADGLLSASVDAIAAVLEPYVRMGPERLSIAGQPVASLREYLRAVSEVSDRFAMLEPMQALRKANTLEGKSVVFSKRPSGGVSTTTSRNGASGASQTAAH